MKACPPAQRRTGRTTWMIKQVVDEVENGQPMCMVYGHSYAFAREHLKPMAERELARRGVAFRSVSQNELDANGTRVVFLSQPDDQARVETRGYHASVFVDHYAAGEL